MFIYAFWDTIFINNYSLKYLNIDRDIEVISLPPLTNGKVNRDNFESVASPRVRGDGKIFYFSNGYASWINDRSINYTLQKWGEEIEYLIVEGMQWGRDMAKVGWVHVQNGEKRYRPYDHMGNVISCEWIELVDIPSSNDWAKFRIVPDKMFRGFSTKVIKGE